MSGGPKDWSSARAGTSCAESVADNELPHARKELAEATDSKRYADNHIGLNERGPLRDAKQVEK